MGTEVALSFSALRAQLENERSSLYKIDENIKKIVQTSGRFQNDRFNNGDFTRSGPRFGGRNSFPDTGSKSDDFYGKRKHETKTAFSRLSARVADDGDEEGFGGKRVRMPSAVTRELPTRAAVLRAQGDDEQARTRNRRIFGSLLGTLQKFKQEEIVLQTKEDKKAQVERKIEEQARLQKEKEIKERKTLFAERDLKKANIKALEAKMARVQEFEQWEASQKTLGNFILTKCKPHIYWLPKKMTDKATEKLNSSRKFHEKCMSRKRQELQDELARIEQRCLRRGPAAKENDPESQDKSQEQEKPTSRKNSVSSEQGKTADDTGRKRDKFAMEEDHEEDKEESDGEEQMAQHTETSIEPPAQGGAHQKEQKEAQSKDTQESQMETTETPNTTMETDDGITKEKSPENMETAESTENMETMENNENGLTENTNGEIATNETEHKIDNNKEEHS